MPLKLLQGLLPARQPGGTPGAGAGAMRGMGFSSLPYLQVLETPSQESLPPLLLTQGTSCGRS